MVNFFENIRNIFLGWLLKIFRIKNDLASKRLNICNTCEHRVNTYLGHICDQCGCVLDAKTRVEDEYCEMNKW